MRKFDNPRFLTRGVQNLVPLETQIYLWQLVDDLTAKPNKKVDYLQVFRLSAHTNESGEAVQKIEHSQEQPRYKKVHYIKPTAIISEKIYIIDSGEYSTMLFAHEY